MSDRDYSFIYPEDKNGNRTGHTICIMSGLDPITKEPRSFFGVALCSPEDQFEYKAGRKIALERALKAFDNYVAKRTKT